MFEPYFDPNDYSKKAFFKKYKYINANFNSKINWAISEDNKTFVFGEDIEFQPLKSDQQFIFGVSGKKFQSLISVEREPYTWGEIKYGKLGLGNLKNEPKPEESSDDNKSQKTEESSILIDMQEIPPEAWSSKRKKIKKPIKIPFFDKMRKKSEKEFNQINFTKYKRMMQGNKVGKSIGSTTMNSSSSDDEGKFVPKFDVQLILKKQDQ